MICDQIQADPLLPPSLLAAALKLEDDKSATPPLLQENVFIESSRPKYLENLHSEALEGLKMMQQEGEKNSISMEEAAHRPSCC